MRIHFALVLPALLAMQVPAHAAHRMTLHQRFEQANTTHDGHLTKEQAEQHGMKAVALHFDAIDKDHKGYVTEADIHDYYKSLRAAHHHTADAAAPPKG
jgi:hypothetical protein